MYKERMNIFSITIQRFIDVVAILSG